MSGYLFPLLVLMLGLGIPLECLPSLRPTLQGKNTISLYYANELVISDSTRNRDYPTQIIRISRPIENQQLLCSEVQQKIDKILVEKITSDKFSYTFYISCNYDIQTNYATHFVIDGYFDPINDEAITFLENYLHDYNGIDLLGTPFTIEAAKGLIVSISLSAGTKKNPKSPPFIEYREDHSTCYFKNDYDMRHTLLSDIHQHFLSNDPNKVLPFLDKWLFSFASELYKVILKDANYALIEPEQIFLMDEGESIYTPLLKHYFPHNCAPYINHRCLNQDS